MTTHKIIRRTKVVGVGRRIGLAWDAFAEADDTTRVTRLLAVADLLEHAADLGGPEAVDDRAVADLLRQLADATQVATGHQPRQLITASGSREAILERIAAEPDVYRRALLLKDLTTAVPAQVAETVAMLPYAPGMVGWRVETYLPTSTTPMCARSVWRQQRTARTTTRRPSPTGAPEPPTPAARTPSAPFLVRANPSTPRS